MNHPRGYPFSIDVHNEFFKEGYPAWIAIGNAALLAQGATVEVRFLAVIGAGKKLSIERVNVPAIAKR